MDLSKEARKKAIDESIDQGPTNGGLGTPLGITEIDQDSGKQKAIRYGMLGLGGLADWDSTNKSIKAGNVEANPFLGDLANGPVGLGVTKAATNAVAGLALDKVAKQHPKIAMALSALLSGGQLAIAAHNYKLAGKK